MPNIQIIEREMTGVEFARYTEARNAFVLSTGNPVQTREEYNFVALDGDAYAGSATGYVYKNGLTYNNWMYLYNLYLERPYRKLGLGAVLLRTLEDRVAELGITDIWTHTVSYEAPGFYQKQGYHIFHQREKRYGGHSEVFLRKTLPNRHVLPTRCYSEAIRLLERPMTEAELARTNAGFDEHTREHAAPVQRSERHSFMAFDGEQQIGYVSGLARNEGQRYNRWFFLTDIFVFEVYRGQGLGSAMLQQIEAKAVSLGCTEMTTEIADFEARSFFARHHFTWSFEFEHWYLHGDSRISLYKPLE